MEHLRPIVTEVPQSAIRLAGVYWPGPLTMIFNKTDLVPYETSGGLDTVAVRMPSHPVAAALIRAAGGYVAAPSANLSGRPSTTNAEHAIRDLSGRIDMIIDSGESDIGLESTIVDFTEDVPVILRPGYINLGMLSEVLGEVKIDPGILDAAAEKGIRPKAPGMRYRHYAPKAGLKIVEGEREQVISRIQELADAAAREGKRTGIMASDETAGYYRADVVKDLGSVSRDEDIAHRLFDALRQFDDEDVDIIYSEAFDTPRMGQAIMNRLLKAAGHEVIYV
jgi:L-threonylcarbamoyladenylate synthase